MSDIHIPPPKYLPNISPSDPSWPKYSSELIAKMNREYREQMANRSFNMLQLMKDKGRVVYELVDDQPNPVWVAPYDKGQVTEVMNTYGVTNGVKSPFPDTPLMGVLQPPMNDAEFWSRTLMPCPEAAIAAMDASGQAFPSYKAKPIPKPKPAAEPMGDQEAYEIWLRDFQESIPQWEKHFRIVTGVSDIVITLQVKDTSSPGVKDILLTFNHAGRQDQFFAATAHLAGFASSLRRFVRALRITLMHEDTIRNRIRSFAGNPVSPVKNYTSGQLPAFTESSTIPPGYTSG